MVALRYRGRTFFVAAGEMFELFQEGPPQYFRKLQPRSALFDESSIMGRSISAGWLIFGLYVLVGLVFAAICGYLAIRKGLSPLPWFFAGLVANVAALFLLLITPQGDLSALPAGVPVGLAKVPTTRTPVRCPECGQENHPSASQCLGCGAAMNPSVEPETKRM